MVRDSKVKKDTSVNNSGYKASLAETRSHLTNDKTIMAVRLVRFFSNPICFLLLLILIWWPAGFSIYLNQKFDDVVSKDSPNCPTIHGVEPGCGASTHPTGYNKLNPETNEFERVCLS